MKSDINPNRPTWKPRTLRTIVHRGAGVHVNKTCAAIVGALLAPQPGAWMCLLNPVVLFKSSAKPQIRWWKKRWVSVKGVQSCLLPLCPAQVWSCGHSCPGVAAQQPGCPWCSHPRVLWELHSTLLSLWSNNSLKMWWIKIPVPLLNEDVELQ